jgi:hypothetical protein
MVHLLLQSKRVANRAHHANWDWKGVFDPDEMAMVAASLDIRESNHSHRTVLPTMAESYRTQVSRVLFEQGQLPTDVSRSIVTNSVVGWSFA